MVWGAVVEHFKGIWMMFQTKLNLIETSKGYWRAEQLNSGASCLTPAEKVSGLIRKHPQGALSWSHKNLRAGLQALKVERLPGGELLPVTLLFPGPPGHRSVERICVFAWSCKLVWNVNEFQGNHLRGGPPDRSSTKLAILNVTVKHADYKYVPHAS